MSSNDQRAIEPVARRGCVRSDVSPDMLIGAVVADAIERGAKAIAVRLEDTAAFVSFDAPTSFDRYLGPPRTNSIWSLGVAARMALEISDGYRRQSALIAGGEALGPVRDHGPTNRRATRVSLMPDPERFLEPRFDRAAVQRRLEAQCGLRPGVVVSIDGARLPRTLSGLVARRAGGEALHRRPLRFAGFRRGVQVDIAIQWCTGDGDIRTVVSGVERDVGARQTLLDALLEAARRIDFVGRGRQASTKSDSKNINEPVVSELLEPGLVAVIAIDGSGDRDDIAAAVRQVAREGLSAHRSTLSRILAQRSRSHLAS